MIRNRKPVRELSDHAYNAIMAKDDFPDFIKETLGKVMILADKDDEFQEGLASFTRKIKNIEKNLKNELVDVDSMIKELYYFLKGKNNDVLKLYFGKATPSKVDGKLKESTNVLENLLFRIANEENNELNNHNQKISDKYSKLKSFTDDITNKEVDQKLLSNNDELNYNEWDVEYGRLKIYVKGFFHKTGIDYRIFFLDMKDNIN